MKPKPIGIIGGAGPLAGALLLEKILSLSRKNYGCYRDADYPKIILISFPFSDMLDHGLNSAVLRKELTASLEQLRQNGASILAIACNTLHAFLEEPLRLSDLVHLPIAAAEGISFSEEPLVLCTSTSARYELHRQFFPCTYPDSRTQSEVDGIIDQVLRGADSSLILQKLERLLRLQSARTVILGCTELSLVAAGLSLSDKRLIDPLELVANKILEKSFF